MRRGTGSELAAARHMARWIQWSRQKVAVKSFDYDKFIAQNAKIRSMMPEMYVDRQQAT